MDSPMNQKAGKPFRNTPHCKQMLRAGSSFLLGLLAATSVLAHGNSTIEDDICTTWINDKMLHMSIFQPDNPKAEYCREVAHQGTSFVTIDLFDMALRSENVGINIVKSPGTPEAVVIARSLPTAHMNGNIRTPVRFEQGIYSVTVEVEGKNPRRSVYQVKVGMTDYSRYIFPILVILLALSGLHRLYHTGMLKKATARFRPSRR